MNVFATILHGLERLTNQDKTSFTPQEKARGPLPGPIGFRGKAQNLTAVNAAGKTDSMARQGIAANHLFDMGKFGSGGLEKLFSGRNIAEKIGHLKGGADGASHFMHLEKPSIAHIHLGSQHGAVLARGDPQPANRGNAGHGLTAKSQRTDRSKFIDAGDFAGGMTLKTEQHIVLIHAQTVIDHPEQTGTIALDLNVYLASTCIDGIFHQLFHHRGRPFDDFAGSYLVGKIFRKNSDLGQNAPPRGCLEHVEHVMAQPLRIPPLTGVNKNAVDNHAEVQMVAASHAGCAGKTEEITLFKH